jgi:hypothetical protein
VLGEVEPTDLRLGRGREGHRPTSPVARRRNARKSPTPPRRRARRRSSSTTIPTS